MIKKKTPIDKLALKKITKGENSKNGCKTNIALNVINQENIGDTSKRNKVREQILKIGNEMCRSKKSEHKQQYMTEGILENKEQRKYHQDKYIAEK